jgi:hypothetical protein
MSSIFFENISSNSNCYQALDSGDPMTNPLSREELLTLRWLYEQRLRRQDNHPETLHAVPLEMTTDNHFLAQLEDMARLQGVELPVLVHRYLAQGFEADLDALMAVEGPRIGRTLRES